MGGIDQPLEIIRCAEEVTRAIAETMGCNESSVSVDIKEIAKE